ncbi:MULTISPECIES: Cof-type HAD-IIB family hydrolase [unclassified Luteococcus]|uniref:Cof-type HAD-IIB family hydrolase n=1 Tax=unclassified Luteococcus TaxID=2639923 RepID=UPI00313CA8EC
MESKTFTTVAIDLDGTLFTPQRDYDRPRFGRMLAACEARDIRVVIASGRQYLSMRTMFDAPERLAFVGDNGSMIVDRDHEVVHCSVLDDEMVRRVVELIDDHPEIRSVASGPEGGWMAGEVPDRMRVIMNSAYENLKSVASLHEIDGPVSKFALVTREGQSERLAAELSEQLGGALVPVTTGHQGMDLIVPGRHKAFGLAKLLERWGRSFDDLLAFGDSANDAEMLAAAGLSYAMADAQPAAVDKAKFRAPTGAESGVMAVVEDLLGY